jgi:tetratricopeptide (TPR) repeat protein
MERAQRIAVALLGVAFASNYCDPAGAQTPERFIRQPAKKPVNPVPGTPSANDPTPTNPTAAPRADATNPQSPVTVEPMAQLAADKAIDTVGVESGTANTVASQLPIETDEFLIFPSLFPLQDIPDPSIDSIEALATVPEIESENLQQKNTDEHTSAAETKFVPTNQESWEPWTTSSPDTASRSGQLRWTSRASGDRPHTKTYNAQLDSVVNGHQGVLAFNSRANTQQKTSQNGFQFSTVASGQPNSKKEPLRSALSDVDASKAEFDADGKLVNELRLRASLVSARIVNDPRFTTRTSEQSSVARIESPQGWQAIGARLSQHVRKCESLLGRGAFCSAREEAEMASMLLYRHIDLHDNSFRCEPAVQSANQTLREVDDFLVTLRSTNDGDSIRRLVDAHATPVLKDKNLSGMSPLTAAQHYLHYAEAQLVAAAQGHPWASELLYTVGRTYQAEADSNSARVDTLRMKALAYYRAARITLPSNAIACNQLGYLLLQMDRNTEAREALIAAVTLKLEEASLSNLAEASRRLGDSQTVAWATQTVAAIRSRTPPPSPVPPYIEVSQEDFIAISPREIGPKTQAETGVVSGTRSMDRSAAAPNNNQLR